MLFFFLGVARNSIFLEPHVGFIYTWGLALYNLRVGILHSLHINFWYGDVILEDKFKYGVLLSVHAGTELGKIIGGAQKFFVP